MRSKSCCLVLPALLVISCHLNQPATVSTAVAEKVASLEQGRYTGHFNKGFMTLVINYISGNVASGYDIHKGLRRNLNGQVDQQGSVLTFVLKEPGGNPYDGTFYFSLDSTSGKIIGKWVPADSTKAHTSLLELARADGSAQKTDEWDAEWEGNLGALTFHDDGTCVLEYYPGGGDAQLKTVRGNYEQNIDTFQIEWQNNKHTPSPHMRLVKKPLLPEGVDSTNAQPHLVGSGEVEFHHNMAG